MENIYEEIVRVLIEQIPDSVYAKDLDGKFVFVNKAKALRNSTTVEDMIGKTDFDFMPKEEAELSCKDDQQIMETGESIKDKTKEITHQDGTKCWMSDTKIPRRNEKGEIIGIFGITRDVTERMSEHLELISAKKKILEMVSILSHDLHNPLSYVGGMLDRIARGRYGFIDESARATIEDIYATGVQVMERIVDDYLNKSLFLEDGIKIRKVEELDMRVDIIDPVLKEFEGEFEIRGIQIDNRLKSIPAGAVMILTECVRVQIVWRNLFSNAIRKFTKETGGEKISFGVEDHGDRNIYNVWDSGPGVPEEERAKLFEKFESGTGGTGLGLATSREIVRQLGGEMWYENTYADHPNFKFSLPKK